MTRGRRFRFDDALEPRYYETKGWKKATKMRSVAGALPSMACSVATFGWCGDKVRLT